MKMNDALTHALQNSSKDPGVADVLLMVCFKELATAQAAKLGDASTPPAFLPFRLIREPVRSEFVFYAALNLRDILAAATSGRDVETGGFFNADSKDLEDVTVHDGILEARYTNHTYFWRIGTMYGSKTDAAAGRRKMEWLAFPAKA